MRLRNSFINKMVLSVVLTSLYVLPGGAHTSSHGLSPIEHFAYEEISEHTKAYYIKQYYHNAQAAYKHYKKIEHSIIHDPNQTLDQLVNVVNKTHSSGIEDTFKIFDLAVKYASEMPNGEVTDVSFVKKGDRATFVITAHESAKRNPFVLLESLIALGNIQTLTSISGEKVTLKPGTNFVHHGWDVIHSVTLSVGHTLGIAEQVSYNPETGMVERLSPIEVMELKTNADAGSILSQRKLAELNVKSFQLFKQSLASYLPLKSMTEAQKKAALSEYAGLKGIQLGNDSYDSMMKSFQDKFDLKQKRQSEALNIQAKQVYKEQNQKYKDGAAEREQVVQTKSLPEMVKANDREGVAQAMEKMLPWALMEPTEVTFWKDFVDAIRKPNYANAPILFRGMDQNEKLQAVTDSSGKVIGGGLFSKRLTAGSGSHLFKLKGLPATFESFGTSGAGETRVSPLNTPHTLTKMMLNHAMNPNGSPFISLTYDLSIAFNFGTGTFFDSKGAKNVEKAKAAFLNSNASGGVITVRMDPRRLITNSISPFKNELEILASLLIFPDEVLHMEKGVLYMEGKSFDNIAVALEDYYKRARAAVLAKTGVQLPESHEEYTKKSGEKAFTSGLLEVASRFSKVTSQSAPMCSRIF